MDETGIGEETSVFMVEEIALSSVDLLTSDESSEISSTKSTALGSMQFPSKNSSFSLGQTTFRHFLKKGSNIFPL